MSSNTAMKEFLVRSRGQTLITRVLIANNGMAAVKAIRSIRKWAYETFGNERLIEFTAMCTPEDLKVNAEYVRMADHYVEIPGGTANHNYSNVDLIVDIAERTRVHAVWVGWGFASENPVLVDKLAQLEPRVVFIGPPASAMRALGDKIASTIVAQSADVPCVDWSGSGITIDTSGGDAVVPDDVYHQATTHDAQEGLLHAKRIGFPVMIKASEGGGGKGIRLVDDEILFKSAFVQVQREVPGSPVFIMRVVRNARHLEVQLLADQYGNAVALFGRDCSVQRRHQKIIEEAPITVAPQGILTHMEQSAVRLAKLVGYVSAGTVEYLYEPQTQKYYFLELNPRLQVEHPTTEMVSGVNIPAAQLQIAMGIPLNAIKDIRILYGLTPTGSSDIDFEFASPSSRQIQRLPSPRGHVIATRITAENPDAGFKPNSGKVLELNFRSNSNVWGYFSVNASGGVHEFADSQFGHVFSYGATRDDARKNLIMALKEVSIRGDFRTTVEYLIKLLETEDYTSNAFTTSWLDDLIAKRVAIERPDAIMTAITGAVAKAHTLFHKNVDEFKLALQKGQTPSRSILATSYPIEFIVNNVMFHLSVDVVAPEDYVVAINNSTVGVNAKFLADGGLLLSIGGKSHVVYTKEDSHVTQIICDGKTMLLEKENDPTKLRSPSPGKLVRYLVDDGCHLKQGEAFAEIEVMKMYMPLLASESGILKIEKPSGSILASGDTIGTLVLDDPSRVKKPAVFDGILPAFGEPQSFGGKAHQVFSRVKHAIDSVLDGFAKQSDPFVLIKRLDDVLKDKELPFLQVSQTMASLVGRIPGQLSQDLQLALDAAKQESAVFPVHKLLQLLETTRNNLNLEEHSIFNEAVLPLVTVIEKYKDGLVANGRNIFVDILKRYLQVEQLLNAQRYETAILELREQNKNDLTPVVNMALASSKDSTRSELILALLHYIRSDSDEAKLVYMPHITQLADLKGRSTAKVALKARELFIVYQLPSADERRDEMLGHLQSAIKNRLDDDETPPEFDYSGLTQLIMAKHSILDILPSFFYNESEAIRAVALYTYILHTYQAYSITSVQHHLGSSPNLFSWEFVMRQNVAKSLRHPLVSGLRGSSTSLSTSSISSFQDLRSLNSDNADGARRGYICALKTLEEAKKEIPRLISAYGTSKKNDRNNLTDVWNIAITDVQETLTDNELHDLLQTFVQGISRELRAALVRRLTFMVIRCDQFPRYFTFKAEDLYQEEVLLRHIEPAMAYQLEFQNLQNFEIKPCFVDNRRLHIYYAVGKKNATDTRFFIRAIMYPGHVISSIRTRDFLISEGNRILTDVLDEIELLSATYPNTDCNHLFLNIVPTFQLDTNEIEQSIRTFVEGHGKRLFKLRITSAEIRFLRQSHNSDNVQPLRFVISSHSGFVMRIEPYQEVFDVTGIKKLVSLSSPPGAMHNCPVGTPYPIKEAIQPKRYKAHLMGTTYVYDFPELFKRALEKTWMRFAESQGTKPPVSIMSATELALNSQEELEATFRLPGTNDCGMVVWEFDLVTPEYPESRQIIVIANDITFNIGSFGPKEDLVFLKASEYARKKGIPRIYISANSGARIGLAEELTNRFKIAWLDEQDPSKGFDYLYIDEADYEDLFAGVDMKTGTPKVAEVERITVNGVRRYVLKTVIGAAHGIGVENLQGSGMIAGETSRAYEEIFTLTLVTCRSVGIGAYLVRLGQRVIQVQYTPIILTGAAALNKVLGRDVYTSNLQLGGPQIMHRNGVSHLVAENDMEGVNEILKWLSYIPSHHDAPLPVIAPSDSVDRSIDVRIPDAPYDPRELICGREDAEKGWCGGLFDKDSFTETLAGWARGVVVGRARLGGIPVGVIAVETRTTEQLIWADPALESSQEQTIKEAGQVWYPNSAFKTAQAINDFNKGEQLPLVILANWRGFSGGQGDMYREVLKFGAFIVDALRAYNQPVFVYLIGELRGGAWVVVDPTINSDMMEMYVSEDARGGVLEPEGIVEIKFRKAQLLASIERLDDTYKQLKKELDSHADDPKSPECIAIKKKITQRETQLLPIYHQAAVHFADLHDGPQRMIAKKVVRRIVPWEDARTFYYWRLLRRISEMRVIKSIQKAVGSGSEGLTLKEARGHLDAWLLDDFTRIYGGTVDGPVCLMMDEFSSSYTDRKSSEPNEESPAVFAEKQADIEVVRWIHRARQAIDDRIAELSVQHKSKLTTEMLKNDPKAALQALLAAGKELDAETRRQLIEGLTKTLNSC